MSVTAQSEHCHTQLSEFVTQLKPVVLPFRMLCGTIAT